MPPKFAIKRAEPVSTDSSRLGAATQRLGLPLGLCLVQLVLANEWLVSGSNKLLNPNFTVQLATNAFNEGVTIDMLVPLLSTALLAANLRAVRAVAGSLSDLPAAVERRLSWAS